MASIQVGQESLNERAGPERVLEPSPSLLSLQEQPFSLVDYPIVVFTHLNLPIFPPLFKESLIL